MGPHEPYWRTNTSFSPPPPRWDFRFQSEGQSFGSQEGSQLYDSSTSSNSRESRSWLRGNYLPNHRHSASDGVGPYFSSPSDFSQWTPPTIQEISVDEYGEPSRRVLGPLSFSPTTEGLSVPQDSRGSISSRSDSSDYETVTKSQSSHRRSFMSKPVHPLTFPSETSSLGFQDSDDTLHPRDRQRLSTASGDFDLAEFSVSELDYLHRPPPLHQSNGHKCSLCERLLAQRSLWSSRRIVRSGDLPVAGVLPCRHAFHAECLDQTTPKARKIDPPCPVCAKSEDEERAASKLKNGFPWGCVQAGNCVEGALSAPPRNAMVLVNRNRVRKTLPGAGKLRKSGTCSSKSGELGGSGAVASGSGKKSNW